MQLNAKFARNPVTHINPPQPHHPVLRQIGALFDPARHASEINPAQSCRPPAARLIRKPVNTSLIIAVNPVAQSLPRHAAGPGRLFTARPIQNHRYGQNPAGPPAVCAKPGLRPQLCRAVLQPRDRYRTHARLRESKQVDRITPSS